MRTLEKTSFFIKFPILENIFKPTANLPFEMAGTDPELKAGCLLGEKTWSRGSFRLKVLQFCSHVHCCWNTACPPSSRKSLYINHSVRIQPETRRCLIPLETILLLNCISCFDNAQRESSVQANRSRYWSPPSYMWTLTKKVLSENSELYFFPTQVCFKCIMHYRITGCYMG